MESSSPTSMEESRNWLELPRDVTVTILMKLGTIEILDTAQFVCKLWYNLCKDPSMWHFIEMQNDDGPGLVKKHEKMLYTAVDRSSGSLLSLDIEGFGSDDLLLYVANREAGRGQVVETKLGSYGFGDLNKHFLIGFMVSLLTASLMLVIVCLLCNIFRYRHQVSAFVGNHNQMNVCGQHLQGHLAGLRLESYCTCCFLFSPLCGE